MPPVTLYPGVYVTEIPSGIRPITGVATSITAFVGRAPRGPVNEPVVVNGFADYQRIFGGLSKESTVSFAVRDFFANGGGQALVVRLATSDATKSTIAVGGLQLEAASPGAWSANLSVTIAPGSTDSDVARNYHVQTSDLFNLTVTDTVTGESESFVNLTVLAEGRNVQHVLAEDSALLDVVSMPTTTPTAGTATVGTAGTDGGPLGDDDYAADALQATHGGLFALDKADLFNLLCIPPPILTDDAQTSTSVYGKALTYCVRRRAMRSSCGRRRSAVSRNSRTLSSRAGTSDSTSIALIAIGICTRSLRVDKSRFIRVVGMKIQNGKTQPEPIRGEAGTGRTTPGAIWKREEPGRS